MQTNLDNYKLHMEHVTALEHTRRDLMNANEELHAKIGALERGQEDLQGELQQSLYEKNQVEKTLAAKEVTLHEVFISLATIKEEFARRGPYSDINQGHV